MKKYVSVLMLLFAACIFFSCDTGGNSKGEEGTKITLDKNAVNVEAGETTVITATVTPTKTVTWDSDKEQIATVSSGTITGVSPGTAKITATTEDGKTATCTVTVTAPSYQLTLDKTTVSVDAGDTAVITATITPAGITTIKSWTSDRPAIATVSNGTVTGVSPGTATITVTTQDGKKTATCAVTVTTPSIRLDLSLALETPPPITFNNDWPDTAATPAAGSNGAVTLTYNKTRQVGLIPLTDAQIKKLTDSQDYLMGEGGFTIRMDVDVSVGTKPEGYDYFTHAHAYFRKHLGDPTIAPGSTPTWNATAGTAGGTRNEDILSRQLVEFRGFDHAWDTEPPRSNFKFFVIQSMFKNADGTTSNGGKDKIYPEVIVTVKSVSIDFGDTRTPAEIAEWEAE